MDFYEPMLTQLGPWLNDSNKGLFYFFFNDYNIQFILDISFSTYPIFSSRGFFSKAFLCGELEFGYSSIKSSLVFKLNLQITGVEKIGWPGWRGFELEWVWYFLKFL